MDKEQIYSERWVNEETAAKHFKVKPSTLRRRRYKLGHDTQEVWTKLHGRVLYDLWASDKRIENTLTQVLKIYKTLEWSKLKGYA